MNILDLTVEQVNFICTVIDDDESASRESVINGIYNVLDGKPPIEQPAVRDNPLAKVEELIEGNYNNIDGVINNLPSGTSVINDEEERPSLLQAIRELRGDNAAERDRDIP